MYTVMNVYAIRMAGVFMISLDTIWLQTRVVPRLFVFLTYALALLLRGGRDLPHHRGHVLGVADDAGHHLARLAGRTAQEVMTYMTIPSTISGGPSIFQVHLGSGEVLTAGDEAEGAGRDHAEVLHGVAAEGVDLVVEIVVAADVEGAGDLALPDGPEDPLLELAQLLLGVDRKSTRLNSSHRT